MTAACAHTPSACPQNSCVLQHPCADALVLYTRATHSLSRVTLLSHLSGPYHTACEGPSTPYRYARICFLPQGYGLARNVEKKLNMYMIINGTKCLGGSAACGDFPDSPEDGWATARAYREHVLRVVARLREDPGAEVEVAEVKARIDEKGSRLRPWTPGDESVRPSVLAAVRAALGAVEQPGEWCVYVGGVHQLFINLSSKAVGTARVRHIALRVLQFASSCQHPSAV